MKKEIILAVFGYCILFTVYSFSQIKITKATGQVIVGGMGGVTKHYIVEFSVRSPSDKNKTTAEVTIDSVKSIADSGKLDFYLDKNEQETYKITFIQALRQPPKCRTCIDTSPKNIDLTKGVIIYYKRGEKKSSFKVKKFKELPDVMMP